MISIRNDNLFIEEVPIEQLCRDFGTPLFVYSKSKLVENFRTFDSSMSSVSHLVCYAIKANSNYSLLNTLAKEGSGADITSEGELYRALKAGFEPQKIVYAGIGKKQEEIEFALKENILMFNVESTEELEQINRIAGRLGKKAKIAFRINPNVDPHTHKYITTGKNDSKFGIPYTEVIEAYKFANQLLNVEIAGIHCHIGSQITSVEPFRLAAVKVNSFVSQLDKIGINLKYINLGGGLGITYRNEKPPLPSDLSKAVLPIFKNFKGTFIFEPGRYIVGNTGILIAKVIYRKKSGGKNYLMVDAGMNDLIRPTLYEAYHDIIPVKNPDRKKIKVDVVGPICETGDFLGIARQLPNLEQGEYLAVKCAGAYGMAMSSQYNSRMRAAEVLVDGSNSLLIRRRENYSDLTSTEIQKPN